VEGPVTAATVTGFLVAALPYCVVVSFLNILSNLFAQTIISPKN
jgi:hypothetical protein